MQVGDHRTPSSRNSMIDSDRKRHVKCDESRPKCSRCQQGRYTCDYEGPAVNGKKLTFVNYTAPPPPALAILPDAQLYELRALDRFQRRTAYEVAGIGSVDMWTQFLLPAAHCEPGVRHAIVALGIAHEEHINSRGLMFRWSDSILAEYRKAVSEVLKLDYSSGSSSVDVALATTVVFASLESLTGHPKAALKHAQSGLRILDEEAERNSRSHTAQIPRHMLYTSLQHFESQSLEVGDYNLCRHLDGTVPDVLFGGRTPTMREAFNAIEVFHNSLQHFSGWGARVLPGAFPDLTIVNRVMDEFDVYRKTWKRMKLALAPLYNQGNSTHMRADGILLKMAEMDYDMHFDLDRGVQGCGIDDFTEEYETLMQYIEAYLDLAVGTMTPPSTPLSTPSSDGSIIYTPSPSDNWSSCGIEDYAHPSARLLLPKPETGYFPTFSLSSSIVRTLHQICTQCRDPRIRRRALRLLHLCNRREGIWDSHIVAEIDTRLIELEEANALQQLRSKLGKKAPSYIENAAQIPPSARIGVSGLAFAPGNTGFTIMLNMPDPATEFRTKKIWREDFLWYDW